MKKSRMMVAIAAMALPFSGGLKAETVTLSLEKALEIALSENVSVKVADMEVERVGFAKKGTYASLFPQIDATGMFQRTIKKQVMYMDFDMGAIGGMSGGSSTEETAGGGESEASSSKNGGGFEVGRWNTWSGGITAAMPLVNAQLWKSLQISGMDVELAVEKARSSRLQTVAQTKQAFFGVLLAKEAFKVYKDVYENAVVNFELTERKYKAEKVSEMEYLRAKTNLSNAVPNVYNAESSVILALWQLKAVMGVDLEMEIDTEGELADFADQMFRDIHENDEVNLDMNSTMRQLAIQAEELAASIKLQKYAYLPTLSLAFNYSYNAMTNDFDFSEYRWTPYSYVGLSLSIPIFSGGKRLNNVRQTKNQYNQLKLQTQDTERQLRIAIRNSLTTMETQMKSYNAAKEAVEMASKSYTIVQKSYEVGRSTMTDLNDAQLALTQSRLAESQAVYNFVVAKAQLEQTLGADFTGYDKSNE
ncbi:MAG: TolC family protein [Bacteroidales bacterium]|nr:TolC family protein [Bacteroidales bacterium]